MSTAATQALLEESWIDSAPITSTRTDFPQWYLDRQQEAWNRYQLTPTPSRKEETWRFSDLKKVRFAGLQASQPHDDEEAVLTRAQNRAIEGTGARFIFANNELIGTEVTNLPEGAIVMEINEAIVKHGDLIREHLDHQSESLGGDKFAALHASGTLSGVFVYLPKNCVCEAPIQLHQYLGGDASLSFPHNLIVAEANSKVSVLESLHSITEGESVLAIGAVDIIARDGAQVQYACLQNLSDAGAKHVVQNHSYAGRDAKIKTAFINLGAAWIRNESINRMREEGSDIQIFGAALANGMQEYDQRTLQVHEAQHTTSDLLFKNALYEKSRTIFSGLIQVKPGAHHTDSFQTCRNLLGCDTAEANSMPGLEIEADQVKCSHGSTSGQIDDEEIFYLQARGIPADQARKMISLGFMNEAISRLEGEGVRTFLLDEVEKKFADVL